jgi:hypothetical protein
MNTTIRNPSIADELNRLRSVMLYDSTLQPSTTATATTTAATTTTTTAPTTTTTTAPTTTTTATATAATTTRSEYQFRPGLNQDPLFWCFYVMKHGAFKYEQLTNRFTVEQDGKRDQVLLLRDKGKVLKQTTGLKFSASTIECDIMSPRISVHAFQVLVRLNSLNAVFVNLANRVYAEFISDAVSDKPVHVIKRDELKTNRITMTMMQATEPQLAFVRATNYRIENPQKPIKSASTYTVADLTEMCNQLKIELSPKMKKQELYDAVVQKLRL